MTTTGKSKERYDKVMRAIRGVPPHFLEGNSIPIWDGTGKKNYRWLSWREYALFLEIEGVPTIRAEHLAKSLAVL
ncbi:MAG: hypothetical protein KGL39_10080 [Patescibacteria group bacterium]|nr:hypothetical protein [Patescibacteria group bacterium]